MTYPDGYSNAPGEPSRQPHMPVPYVPAAPPVPSYGAHPGFGQQPTHAQPPGYGPHPGLSPGNVYPPVASRKEVGIAYLLWFFFGGLGVHHFYLGRTGWGATYLLLLIGGILTSWVLIGFLALFALAIMLLVDLFAIPSYTERANMTGGLGRQY